MYFYVNTNTLVTWGNFGLYNNRSTAGSMNAIVFPEPVIAHAQMSLPVKAIGIAVDWIDVGFIKFIFLRA